MTKLPRHRDRNPGRRRFAVALLLTVAWVGAAAEIAAQTGGPGSEAVEGVQLPHVREWFYQAVDDASVTEELIAFIQQHFSSDPALYPPAVLAYYAALQGLRGRHDANLLRKYRFVRNAIDLMDPLLAAHPNLLELRFLRFSFYEQIPAVFGVQRHVAEDLAEAVAMLSAGASPEVPLAVQIDMIDYILGTHAPTAEQRRTLETLGLRLRPR